MALNRNMLLKVNGRVHVSADRLYVEKLGEQHIVRVRNDFGGLFYVLTPENMRETAAKLTELADKVEAAAAEVADAAIKKAMGKL